MNKLTQKAIALVETPLIRTARVLAVRDWQPGTIREIDLHMPDCDMSRWDSTQHIKCKVGILVYRDYTPSGWDAETRTCTLLIHVAHEGPGSNWGKRLKAGNTVSYIGVSSSHQKPVTGKKMVFLGDETTIGHFLALQQLAGKGTDITGAILMAEPHHREEFDSYFLGWGLESLQKDTSYLELDRWIGALELDGEEAVFYLAGYSPAVVRWRKLLRHKGLGGRQVKMQGFWD